MFLGLRKVAHQNRLKKTLTDAVRTAFWYIFGFTLEGRLILRAVRLVSTLTDNLVSLSSIDRSLRTLYVPSDKIAGEEWFRGFTSLFTRSRGPPRPFDSINISMNLLPVLSVYIPYCLHGLA